MYIFQVILFCIFVSLSIFLKQRLWNTNEYASFHFSLHCLQYYSPPCFSDPSTTLWLQCLKLSDAALQLHPSHSQQKIVFNLTSSYTTFLVIRYSGMISYLTPSQKYSQLISFGSLINVSAIYLLFTVRLAIRITSPQKC